MKRALFVGMFFSALAFAAGTATPRFLGGRWTYGADGGVQPQVCGEAIKPNGDVKGLDYPCVACPTRKDGAIDVKACEVRWKAANELH